MATSTPNTRASLLAGLRTGGVRSTSQPFSVPHTAAPTGHFNVPRYVSAAHPMNSFPDEDDEIDQLSELTSQFAFDTRMNGQQFPMTASAVESNLMFQRQQQQMLSNQSAALNSNFVGNVYNSNGQQLDLQAQMLQMEMLKYQALQQQAQYQAEFIAQTQRQLHSAQPHYARSFEPMTAAPNVTSFDHRANAIAQLRARQLDRLSIPSNEDYVSGPMTASIDGKFGSRALNPHAASFMSRFGDHEGSLYSPLQSPPPITPGRTTVISGGTSLGTMAAPSPNVSTPSKSDVAVSWRRGVATPNTPSRVSPPSFASKALRGVSEEVSKGRPEPLQLHHHDNSDIPSRVYNESSGEDDPVSGSSKAGSPTSASTPPTPPPVQPILSAEPKKLYENLGIGKPISITNTVSAPRFVSLPSRQPKGPPSGADELGPRNFASRIRRQAIGGLGVLVNAREQRELAVEVQVY
ncbi:hypothetical protein Clacol_001568 [Clathrus columnatus]|uniref:Uncharacterized protein n=1 Tax=Clathrus columnatus TaxID=1419009 RepID=A0AAV4ZYI9_9AGAM|nr:hypothetical protein Clacol_001568 [Clathrus columnatus]